MRRILAVVGAALTLVAAHSIPLAAQGSSVYTHSGCMSARAGAGVADPCADGSAIFYNPAALALHPGVVSVGLTAIRTDNTFTYDVTGRTIERDAAVSPVPYLFASYRLSDRLALGFGAWAPYGLGIQWPLSFEGRFVGYDNALRGIYFQPTVAYEIIPGRLAIGGGVDIVRGSLEINRRLDLARQQIPFRGRTVPAAKLGIPLGTDFADVRLQGEATTATFHVGALAIISDRLSIGARYMHSADLGLEGTATFEQIPTGLTLRGRPLDPLLGTLFEEGAVLADQAISTELTLPSMAVVGVRFNVTPRWKLLADYQFTNWSSFDRAELNFETAPTSVLLLEYEDAHTFHVGTEFRAEDALDLRLGYRRNTAATPEVSVTPLLPEAEWSYLAGGLGYAQRVAAFNSVIQQTAETHGWIYLDPSTLFAPALQNPDLIRKCQGLATATARQELAAAIRNTCPAPTAPNFFGALLSFDGVHPSTAAHKLIANAIIRRLNQAHDLGIPLVETEITLAN